MKRNHKSNEGTKSFFGNPEVDEELLDTSYTWGQMIWDEGITEDVERFRREIGEIEDSISY